jgi:trimethyllysine dioxygenase
MKDTAYTNLALPAHTDTTYFTDPAGLQMFHLLSHTDGSGGASLLVDGFEAARKLRKEFPDAYKILAITPVSWHASGNQGITITPAKKMPVLGFHNIADNKIPKLMQVRWNNDDRGVLALRGDHGMSAEKWYGAARKWNEILKRKSMEYWAQLEPGRPLSTYILVKSAQPSKLKQSSIIGESCMGDLHSQAREEYAAATLTTMITFRGGEIPTLPENKF